MSTIKTKIVDQAGKPLGFGVSASIVKASDKLGSQIGAGYISDDDSVLEINSPLLDYKDNASAVDILVEAKGYEKTRVSPDEFAMQPLALRKSSLINKATASTKNVLRKVPPVAWETGGVVLVCAILIAIVSRKVK
jgi:hypothetical protein